MIAPEAVDLFRRAHAIEQAGLEARWEDRGGRRREYLGLSEKLRGLLELRLWETGPLSVDEDDEPPSWITDPEKIADWRRAVKLHRELLAKVGI